MSTSPRKNNSEAGKWYEDRLRNDRGFFSKFINREKVNTLQQQLVIYNQQHIRGVLDKIQNVDLQKFDRFTLGPSKDLRVNNALLQDLYRKKQFRPPEEIFWNAYRLNYDSRIGISVMQFLKDMADPHRKQLILELGCGSGRAQQHREQELGNAYYNVGLCNYFYWEIAQVLERAIDFEKLAEDGYEISKADQPAFCTFIYKILVIEEGSTDESRVPYDTAVFERLCDDPESLEKIIKEKAPMFKHVKRVPHSEGYLHEGHTIELGDDGHLKKNRPVVHPWREENPHPKALEHLGDNLERYLKIGVGKGSVLDCMDVDPTNKLQGDFFDIGKLKDCSIDVALEVRALAYLKPPVFQSFCNLLVRKLTKDGIAIGDGVRANFAEHYKIESLRDTADRTGMPVYVILGPGQPEEAGIERVPCGWVMTASEERLASARKNLLPGYKLMEVNEFIKVLLQRYRNHSLVGLKEFKKNLFLPHRGDSSHITVIPTVKDVPFEKCFTSYRQAF